MDLRRGARVTRLESVEMGAVTVIVLASVVQGFFFSWCRCSRPCMRVPGRHCRCGFVSILLSATGLCFWLQWC